MSARKVSHEAGSAIVEFVLVSVPLLLLAMTVIAVGLSGFTMAVLRDSAVEGARYSALADQFSSAGCIRATQLAKGAIGKFATIEARCDSTANGFEVVQLNAQLVLFGLLSESRKFTAISRAPREE